MPLQLYTKVFTGTSLVAQCARLRPPNAGGSGLIPGQGTKIPHATLHGQEKKKKDHSIGERKSFQQMVLGLVDIHTQNKLDP